MIRTLIIEDEAPAAVRLEKLLGKLNPQIEVLAHIDTVEGAIHWLQQHESPDLLMLDIQLADGISFEIFRTVQVDCAVIFTTAYDEYAIRAFELNSIDYLLKPIQEERLKTSLTKLDKLRKASTTFPLDELLKSMQQERYKKRFAVSYGNKIHSIETKQISYFHSTQKSTFLRTNDGHEYPLDYSLDRLESLLDPEQFFRINRQQIIRYSAIQKIDILSKSRLQLRIQGYTEPCLVSAAKTPVFREWIDK